MHVSREVVEWHGIPVAGALLIRNGEMATRAPKHAIVEYEFGWPGSDLSYRGEKPVANTLPDPVNVVAEADCQRSSPRER